MHVTALPSRGACLGSNALFKTRSQAVAPARRKLVIENAHKKGAGSTKNGRESNAQRRGVKVWGGQPVKDGGIIVRQTGNTFHAGNNVLTGKDYTLYSIMTGTVVFETIKQRKCVSVYPEGHEKTEGLQLKRKPDGRKAKRLEQWKGTPRARKE